MENRKITEDDDYALFTVTLFQRIAEEFSIKARERKFVVRDFKWDAEKLSAEKKQFTELTGSEREQWVKLYSSFLLGNCSNNNYFCKTSLLRLSKTNFGELYSAWIHIKVLRTFVESILRYGLPPNFQPMIIEAKPKQETRVRQLLNKHYSYLDSKGGSAGPSNTDSQQDETIDENIQLLMGDKDYCPAVLFPLNLIAS